MFVCGILILLHHRQAAGGFELWQLKFPHGDADCFYSGNGAGDCESDTNPDPDPDAGDNGDNGDGILFLQFNCDSTRLKFPMPIYVLFSGKI